MTTHMSTRRAAQDPELPLRAPRPLPKPRRAHVQTILLAALCASCDDQAAPAREGGGALAQRDQGALPLGAQMAGEPADAQLGGEDMTLAPDSEPPDVPSLDMRAPEPPKHDMSSPDITPLDMMPPDMMPPDMMPPDMMPPDMAPPDMAPPDMPLPDMAPPDMALTPGGIRSPCSSSDECAPPLSCLAWPTGAFCTPTCGYHAPASGVPHSPDCPAGYALECQVSNNCIPARCGNGCDPGYSCDATGRCSRD